MADVNVITIGGRLVHDPETRQTKGGSPMCKFRLANNRVSFGVVKTVFQDVRVFGKQCETCQRMLAKGNHVSVVGELDQTQCKNKDGKEINIFSVNAISVIFDEPKDRNAQLKKNDGISSRTTYPDDEQIDDIQIPF